MCYQKPSIFFSKPSNSLNGICLTSILATFHSPGANQPIITFLNPTMGPCFNYSHKCCSLQTATFDRCKVNIIKTKYKTHHVTCQNSAQNNRATLHPLTKQQQLPVTDCSTRRHCWQTPKVLDKLVINKTSWEQIEPHWKVLWKTNMTTMKISHIWHMSQFYRIFWHTKLWFL